MNVGIGLLSTFNQWKAVNTTHLMEAFVDYAPASWGLSPGDLVRAADRRPAADGPVGRPPRRARPTWWSGDAGGAINPFNGEGIAYAYETGRMAAGAVHAALGTGDGLALASLRDRAPGRPTGCTTRWPGRS